MEENNLNLQDSTGITPAFIFTMYKPGYINDEGVAVPSPCPMQDISLVSVYKYIIGGVAKKATREVREIQNHKDSQRFKALSFLGVTPAGIFSYRSAKDLKCHSGLMVIDIDDITSHKRLLEIREQLIADPEFETELLFVSPSGRGLKWIIYVGDMGGRKHADCFAIVRKYLWGKYGIEADRSGSDVCRLCYLPYDPDCYINPELLDNFKDQQKLSE